MNGIEKKVIELINTTVPDITIEEKQTEVEFDSFDIDSMIFMSIIVELEEEFDIEIPDEYLILENMNTVKKIANILSTLGVEGE